MGQLIFKMGKFEKAEEIDNIVFDETPDDDQQEITYLNHQLGVLEHEKRDLPNSLSYYEKTLKIQQKSFSPNQAFGSGYQRTSRISQRSSNKDTMNKFDLFFKNSRFFLIHLVFMRLFVFTRILRKYLTYIFSTQE
jgi:tetratricopeptide (TPR) repeat protein